MWAGRGLTSWLRLFGRDVRAGLALNFALAILPLSMITCGAVDFASVLADKQRMQDVADASALDAASQLVLANTSGVSDRTNAFALSQLARVASRITLSSATDISAKGDSVTVTIDGHRMSFFANLLPPGGFHLRVKATAMSMGRTPLCVLHSGSSDQLSMAGGSLLTAPGCLVHSDGDIKVIDAAYLQADATQSVGTATGRITPAPLSGAATIKDPFAAMTIDIPKLALLCTPLDLLYDLGLTYTLGPGVHCGKIDVRKNSVLKLLPGDHYFAKGKLSMEEGSTLTGTNVALIFDNSSDLTFKDSSKIELEGRKSGAYSGFVILTTRNNKGKFDISSNNARKLLGTIYIPSATLDISGSATKVADESAWTVIVAKAIHMTGSPNLVINNNYAGASVPVPEGVGKNRGVVLTH